MRRTTVSDGEAIVPTFDASVRTWDDLSATVRISRDHPRDFGQRQVIVTLDGGRSEHLLFGDSLTIEVLPGRHHLKVHNTLFWKNLDFAIEPGEHLEFIVINRASWWTPGVVGLLGAAPLFLTVIRRSLQ
jgi:hypothetical protein